MKVLTRYLRRQFYTYWPLMGRMARLTAYFAGVDILLFVIWRVARLVKPGSGSSLEGWVRLLTFVTAALLLLLAARWMRRKVMWRLRNRLIVTYVFIGVIPVVLLLAMALIGTYLFAWQFATFVATSDIRADVGTLGALNERMGLEAAARLVQGASWNEALLRQIAGHEPRFAEREITGWYRGKAVVLRGQPAGPPPGNASENSGLALDGGRILLRVSNTSPAGKDNVVLISS